MHGLAVFGARLVRQAGSRDQTMARIWVVNRRKQPPFRLIRIDLVVTQSLIGLVLLYTFAKRAVRLDRDQGQLVDGRFSPQEM